MLAEAIQVTFTLSAEPTVSLSSVCYMSLLTDSSQCTEVKLRALLEILDIPACNGFRTYSTDAVSPTIR